MSIDRGMDKDVVYIHTYTHTHTHNGILLSHKIDQIMPLEATRMDLEFIIPHKVSQTQKDKYHLEMTNINDTTYMWNLKKMTQKNLFTK